MNKDVVPWPSDLAARYRAGGLWRGQTVGAWFTERAALFADRTAVVEGARRVTYRMLAASAARLACSFSGLGLRPGDRVVVQLPNGVELVEVLLALFGSGLVPVLALPAHRQIELEAFCSGTGATALIVSARQGATDLLPMAARIRRSCAATVRHLVVHGHSGPLDPDVQPLEALYDASDEVALGILGVASEMALLQLSGGSTGIPKLVPRTHDDYLYSVRASAELCRLTPETRYLAALPMTHNFTLSSPGVLGVLHAGGCVVACSHPIPDVALRLLVSERITITSAVPSLARAWMDAKARCLGECALTGLLLQIGGARLDEGLARDLLRVMGCRLQQVFGMAEGLVNYTRLDAPEEIVVTTQGKPLSLFDELRVVDPSDSEGPPLPSGSVGELQTRGPYTIRGYLDVCHNDGAHFTRDGFYRTGDLVQITEAGDVIVEGRLGERIVRAGEKISPEEVERHMRSHPRVRDAAIVGCSDPHLGERSHAFVVQADDGPPLLAEDLRGYLRNLGIADFKLPDVVHVVRDLPRTTVGKTDKVALRHSLNTL